MKLLSEAIRAGRYVHRRLHESDRHLPEYQNFFGMGASTLEEMRSSILGAALVGLLGTIAAFKIIRIESGISDESNQQQLQIMLRQLFPILSEITPHPLTGEKASVRDILNDLQIEWNEAESVKWLEGYETKAFIQIANGVEFIETIEADGSRNRFFAGNVAVRREHCHLDFPPLLSVIRLHHGGEIDVVADEKTERISARSLVNYAAAEHISGLVKEDASLRHGDFLPFSVGREKFFDIESAMSASIGIGHPVKNGFGWLANHLNDAVARGPKLTNREIVHSHFFEVSGDYFPAGNIILPNRDDFETEEAFETALREAYETAYPESAAGRLSFSVASTEGYAYQDEEGNWQVFENRSAAFDALAQSSTTFSLRRDLAAGRDPNLLIQDAEIAPVKIGDRWFWLIARFKGSVYHDGIEVSVALNTSSANRYGLVFD